MPKQIVMIGSARETRSGISAVVNVYFSHGLFRRWRACYLPTHGDGTRLRKAGIALASWLAFMARLLTGQVALVHVHLSSGPSFWRKCLFVLPARVLGVPYVLHVHCGRFAALHRGRAAWVQALGRSVFRKAHAVIALSEGAREALATIAPDCRFAVVPNPVQIPEWQAALERSPPTVLFLGTLKPHKGVYELLQAWPSVLEAVPDARLVIAGSIGTARARELARSLGIEQSVHMPGWVVGEEKSALIRQAWVFALPSHAEALPMAILECMAAGVPVVSTPVGSIASAVEHGRTGLMVAPGNVAEISRAIVALLADPARRKEMGPAARRRATHAFSADAMVPRMEALWREFVPAEEIQANGRARGPARPAEQPR
jgi:glycosyltransferase involved in cell wall biosynthesis